MEWVYLSIAPPKLDCALGELSTMRHIYFCLEAIYVHMVIDSWFTKAEVLTGDLNLVGIMVRSTVNWCRAKKRQFSHLNSIGLESHKVTAQLFEVNNSG